VARDMHMGGAHDVITTARVAGVSRASVYPEPNAVRQHAP